MTKIDQIAQAFAQGVKFAENMKLAMDAAKGKDDEDGHWVTIGEGEEARPVFIKGAKKKAAKAESKKKNDQIFHSMSRKEFADMFRSTGGDELSENNTLKIWYKDHTFKHFDYESDRKELARALRQPGIKAIAWSNEGDVGYYGSPDDIVMRNVNTDETKPLSEVQKDAGVGSLWVVDDVTDNSGNKKTESKPAQQRPESPREMAARINREQTARASRSQEDIEAAHQLSLKVDRSFMRELMRVQDNAWSLNQRIKDARSMSMPGADTRNAMSIRNSLRQIQDNISAFDKTMGKIQGQISTAAKDGKIGEGRVNAELRHYRKYCNTFDDYLTRTDNQMANLSKMTNDGHREDREVLSKIANLTSEMAKSATDWRESMENKAHEQNAERTESPAPQSQPRAQRSTSSEAQTVKALEDAYNVSADLIDEMTPKQADRPFLSRLDSLHKKAVALAKSTPEINNSQELREMTRIMKQADKLVKALPSYYDRNYYGGWVQNLMGKVRAAEEAYTKLIIKTSLKKSKTRGPNAAI